MLQHLSIDGLAIIEHLEIDFAAGFNVITGETGAGKSILIKALSLLFGAKAGPETVRQGKESALIGGSFHLAETHPVFKKLIELGIIDSPEMELLIRRRIFSKGRTQAWINDRAVATTTLRDIGELLIDIFAQHENQRLLNGKHHLEYVDAYFDDREPIKAYRSLYKDLMGRYNALATRIDELSLRSRDQDYWQFRLNELEAFAPNSEDYEQLKQITSNLRLYVEHQQVFAQAQALLDQSVDGESLSRPLRDLQRLLSKLQQKQSGSVQQQLQGLSERALELAEGIDQLSYELSTTMNIGEQSEIDLETAEDRIAAYQDLLRKFALNTVEELVAQQDTLHQALAELKDATSMVYEELKFIDNAATKLLELAATLSEERRVAAAAIKKGVEEELAALAMPAARLAIEFAPIERTLRAIEIAPFGAECMSLYQNIADTLSTLGEWGSETAEFFFSANRGEQMFPLHRIASGGEVSRIMLAFKRTLTLGADSCLLVFDEIDAGISGKVADMVGAKIKDLAKNFQVLCISHLAQVSAYCDAHFVVRKSDTGTRTESTMRRLNSKESIEELARLLSGTEITKQSIANAKTMVERVQHLSVPLLTSQRGLVKKRAQSIADAKGGKKPSEGKRKASSQRPS